MLKLHIDFKKFQFKYGKVQETTGDLFCGTPPRRVRFHLGHSRSSSDDSNRRDGASGSCEENVFGQLGFN